MKKNFLKLTALFFIAAIFTLTSCKKGDADTQSAEDSARGSFIMADAFALGSDGRGGGKALKNRFDKCTFTFHQLDNGFELTFDNCTDDDGITRNGTIRFTGDENIYDMEESASFLIEFINFTIEDEVVDGKLSLSVGAGTLGAFLKLAATNLKITYSNGEYVKYNTATLNYVINYLNGFNIEISGASEGINRNGETFSTETEGLKINFFSTSGVCTFPTEGTMTINVEGEKNPVILDYGAGGCGEIKVSQKRHKDATITIF